MSIHKLAPVHWKMGQTLLPDHLLAQENALAGEARLHYQAQGLPSFGIAKCEWDAYLLAQGSLKIEALRLFTRSKSAMVDYPGNTQIISTPLNFSECARPQVYYFVLQEKVLQEKNNTPAPASTLGEATTAPQRLFKLLFCLQPTLPKEYDALVNNHSIVDHGKFAEFEKSSKNSWGLSERYIPPLMQVGTSEFLQRPLQQLSVLLSRHLSDIHKQYQQKQLPDVRLYEIKQCASVLSQALQYLANHLGSTKVSGEIFLHPYFLYEQLHILNRELTLSSGDWKILNIKNYRHNDLHGLFKRLFRSIIAHLKRQDRNSQSFELHLKDGCYQTALPNSLHAKDKLYLVINCDQRASLPDAQLPCLSSQRRMGTLYHYALSGAALAPVRHSALTHYFGESTQCFQLQHGEELRHIQEDGSIAFLAQPEFEGYTFYIFYQPTQLQHVPKRKKMVRHGVA